MKSIKDIKCFQGHLRRQKRSGVKRKQLDMVGDHLIRGFMVLSIDMGIGVDIPEAHVLKEAMKHTVVDTEVIVIHMGTVMVLDTERKDWELCS